MISLVCANALHIPLANETVQCVITSPPYYGLRDYGIDGQLGLEPDPDDYIAIMRTVFKEIWRVLRDDGTVWLNIGDSYVGSGKAAGNGGKGPASGKQLTNKGSYFEPVKSKRMARGAGRWGGGNLPATDGLKPKDLIGIPWMLAFALRADGWYLRSDIIWHKPNPMPESVRDRPTKSHEYVFLLSKNQKYYCDMDAIREPVSEGTEERYEYAFKGNGKRAHTHHGDDYMTAEPGEIQAERGRNRRSVWTIPTSPYSGAHFATFPPDLVEPCLLAGSADGDLVLDPFAGTFTVGMVAAKHRRNAVGIELNPKYIELARKRCSEIQVRMI